MKREEFIIKSLSSLGILAVTPFLNSCNKNSDSVDPETEVSGTTNGSSSDNCAVTNSETAGPFPIKDPSSLVKSDIRGDRNGVLLDITLTIKNQTSGCGSLEGALVDIWHCDAAGSYSEYGGTQMQQTNYTNVHWLRGRQTTSSDGSVKFTSIFPGWYSGRAPHIHVHVYSAAGKSLLVTQIAFPKSVCDTVYTAANDYKSHGTQDTTNERDNVFGDGYENELASISGSVSAGYELTHTIVVEA